MLIGLGARIEGEAGVGYVLRPGFFLPPLMFEPDELEALVLGARWVQAQPDAGLSRAASTALTKISTASPDDLRRQIRDVGLWPVSLSPSEEARPVLGPIRAAMRAERALLLSYTDESGRASEREVWPVQLAFYDGKQIVVAWCVLREAFRHFRIDRIQQITSSARRYGRPRTVLAQEWWAEFSDPGRRDTPDTG